MPAQVGPDPNSLQGGPTTDPFAIPFDGGVGLPGSPAQNHPSAPSNPSRKAIPHSPTGFQEPGSNSTTYDKDYHTDITFYHPSVGTLTNQYGINYVTWDYRLNTQHFSTYAGEVVQILSVAVDDIIIRGQIANYAQMEMMFKYFAQYMERATQGSKETAYQEDPIRITYPHRGWDFNIQPKEMLGFNYGRDVVVPEWEITAAVYDISPSIEKDLTVALANSYLNVTGNNPQASSLDDTELPLEGQIGFNPNNPFSNPFPQEGITGKTNPALELPAFKDFGQYYNDIVKNFSTNNFNSVLDKFGSSPNFNTNQAKVTTKLKG